MTEQRSDYQTDRVEIAEVAARLGVTESAAYDYLKSGIVPATKRGRRWLVLRGPFEQWLAGRPSTATPPADPRLQPDADPPLSDPDLVVDLLSSELVAQLVSAIAAGMRFEITIRLAPPTESAGGAPIVAFRRERR